MSAAHERRIVVGVDGSEESRAALRWAVGQARLTSAIVEAVTVWKYPSTLGYNAPFSSDDFATWADESLSGCVSDALEEGKPVDIRKTVVHGDATKALLEAAHGAQLLVVGNRGHSGLSAALLRSVGHQCAHHVTCPLILVSREQH